MSDRTFSVLGIEPTIDYRRIRAAYLRLARIYHPDRYSDQPADVQAEAARRMKEVTAAYRTLVAGARTPPPSTPQRGHIDPWEQARGFREAIERRQREDANRVARWQTWERLEREARERARWEASIIGGDATVPPAHPIVAPPVPEGPPPPKRSLLQIRLEEARGVAEVALTRKTSS